MLSARLDGSVTQCKSQGISGSAVLVADLAEASAAKSARPNGDTRSQYSRLVRVGALIGCRNPQPIGTAGSQSAADRSVGRWSAGTRHTSMQWGSASSVARALRMHV